MLEQLSKQDKKWRQIAYFITKDKALSDDVVQEMYLRVHRNPKEKLTEYYVIQLLKSVFLNYLKTKKEESSISNLYYIECKERIFEPSDEEQELLNKYNGLKCWQQQELLAESYDRSYREIQEHYPLINYGYAYRQVKQARELILDK